MQRSIEGHVALVTGASSGIGAATAKALAAAGARVGLAARRRDKLAAIAQEIRAAGGEATAIGLDVSAKDSVKAGVDSLTRTFGPIDIVVNNAGLMPASDVAALKTDEWHEMVDVNLKGVLHVTAAVLPQMMARSTGHLVNVSSIAGRKVFKGLAVYCATKHAVAALSEGLRMELGAAHGIRVTCIQPGAVETELYERISDPGYRGQMESLKQEMEFLKAADIADAILFAVSAPPNVDMAELFVMPRTQAW
ncbi:SDR family oxidoreductase [Rhodoplanes sp. TEM]|uniref:SDR family oxidoreductase n=1 Tax=Rhodoplanes tepidamans TaxID=200616 RepID=A0ABT5JIG1_RHOTP|nr:MULTISPECIES: SDR family oxidoreductase [Rhodoplanes]MDC7788810.1 SDR family oxidoreductase [Rhodoplanes tepidamans]MDC7983165.1 SDR family oxidoreductase [Rhodoplanes sp. TEM]MDQ0357623.1 NADP-dependent 3-hydroxy acid dehydrogenase YdfG [Rhodoplanes tepidamans]